MKPRLAIPYDTSASSARAADSMDAIYDQHLAQVKRWARSLAGPSADLEDWVHDISLIAFCKGFRFRGEATMPPNPRARWRSRVAPGRPQSVGTR